MKHGQCEYCFSTEAAGVRREWEDRGERFAAILCETCWRDSGVLHLLAEEVRADEVEEER